MASGVVFGNAASDGRARRGWFVGSFLESGDGLRRTGHLEVKWAVHPAGDCRESWSFNREATSLSILVSGRFRLRFADGEVVLAAPGDYALWAPGIGHCWWAEEPSVIMSVRWPSQMGDSVAMAPP